MSDTATADGAQAEPFTEDELAEARRCSMVIQGSPEDGV